MGAYYSDDCGSCCHDMDSSRACPYTGFHYCYRESDIFLTMKTFSVHERTFAPSDSGEEGNAIAAFVFIIPLVLLVLFSLIALIYALHIRFLAEDAAFEGAKAGSLSGGDSVLAESRTRDVLSVVFNGEYCANPDITTNVFPNRSIEVSLHCPSQNSPWFGMYLPDMTVSAYAHIE